MVKAVDNNFMGVYFLIGYINKILRKYSFIRFNWLRCILVIKDLIMTNDSFIE